MTSWWACFSSSSATHIGEEDMHDSLDTNSHSYLFSMGAWDGGPMFSQDPRPSWESQYSGFTLLFKVAVNQVDGQGSLRTVFINWGTRSQRVALLLHSLVLLERETVTCSPREYPTVIVFKRSWMGRGICSSFIESLFSSTKVARFEVHTLHACYIS